MEIVKIQRNKRNMLLVLLLFVWVNFLFPRATDSTFRDLNDAKQLRKQFKSKTFLDRVAGFPGDLIYFPLRIFLKGAKETIIIVDNGKIIPRVKDFLTSDDGRRGVMPTYASRVGAGIIIYQRGLINPRSKLSLTLTAGLQFRQNYELRFKRLRFVSDRIFSDFRLSYRYLPTESFYGIGPNSRKDDKTDYAPENVSFEGAFGVSLTNQLSLEAVTGYDLTNILEGKDNNLLSINSFYTAKTLPGLAKNTEIFRFELELLLDSRNKPGNPSSGFDVLVEGGYFRQIDKKQFGFWKTKIDIARYLHLFYRRVLVLRIAGGFTDPFSNRQIPFFYLHELGEWESIRGFARGRFRDNDFLLGSAEYRFPVSRGLDGLLFVDAGQVSTDILKYYINDNLEITFGGGIRLWSTEGLVMKLEAGRSKDGFRVIFKLN